MEKETINRLKSVIRDIPDFPTKGILFRDLTTLFKDAEALSLVADEMKNLYS
jgi:adenine phosphoribosyltransferase